jgi:hypothetical protein
MRIKSEYELVGKAGEGSDVAHHAGRAVDNSKMVPEEFLGPAANLVDVAVVVKDFFHSATVTKPVEEGAPEVFT